MSKKVRLISLREIENKKLLSKFSPIYLLAKELELKYLIKENGLFTGPAIGLASLIDKITLNFPIESMLDLCCGTGALSKIALLNGVKEVVCLDLNTKAVEENLSEFKDRVKIVKCDILGFDPKKFYELIVLDAPRNLIEKLFKRLIPKIVKLCDVFVIWHGSSEEKEWNVWVRNRLRNFFSRTMEVSCYGEEISCCSSTKNGIELIKKLFKLW